MAQPRHWPAEVGNLNSNATHHGIHRGNDVACAVLHGSQLVLQKTPSQWRRFKSDQHQILPLDRNHRAKLSWQIMGGERGNASGTTMRVAKLPSKSL